VAIALLGSVLFGPSDTASVGGSYTCHSGSNRKLIVWVGGEVGGGSNVNSVTYDGEPLTKYQEDDGGTHNNIAMFYLDEADFPSTPGSYTLTATFSETMAPGFVMAAEISGASTGDPTAYEHNYVASSDTNNDSITTTADGSWIFSCVGVGGTGTFTADSGQTILQQNSGGGGGAAYGHSYESIATAGSESSNWTFSTSTSRFLQSCCCIEPVVALTYDQEGARWRDDDGSETGASWLAAQDTNINRGKNTNTRVRITTDVAGDPPSEGTTLDFRLVGDPDSEWEPVA